MNSPIHYIKNKNIEKRKPDLIKNISGRSLRILLKHFRLHSIICSNEPLLSAERLKAYTRGYKREITSYHSPESGWSPFIFVDRLSRVEQKKNTKHTRFHVWAGGVSEFVYRYSLYYSVVWSLINVLRERLSFSGWWASFSWKGKSMMMEFDLAVLVDKKG